MVVFFIKFESLDVKLLQFRTIIKVGLRHVPKCPIFKIYAGTYSMYIIGVWCKHLAQIQISGPGPDKLFVLKINPGQVGWVVIYYIFF